MFAAMTPLRVAALSVLPLLWSCTKPTAAGAPLKVCEGARLSAVTALAASFDSVELRYSDGPRGDERAGEPCKTAKDKAACVAAVEKATASSGWNNGSHGRSPGYRYAVVTRGDEVLVITPDTLLGALGAIDTPVKAGLIAGLQRGVFPRCEGSVRTVNGRYEVHLVSDSCFGSVDDVVLIDAKGALEVVSSSRGSARCVGALQSTGRPTL